MNSSHSGSFLNRTGTEDALILPAHEELVASPLLLPADRPENILTAAQILRDGGLVVVPTDTLYGLAASVLQPEAIEGVFAVKRRAPEMRVPLLLGTAADLPILVQQVPRIAWKLIDAFWPGPLTLVLPARPTVPRQITRGGNTVAVRVPAAKSCLELLQTLGEPIVGTSANLSGQPPATSAADAVAQIGSEVDAVLVDDDAIQGLAPSSIVEFVEGHVVLRRMGVLNIDAIREALGPGVRLHDRLTTRSHPR